MQRQKSRLLWLKEGDANTKFFHNIMYSRRRVNSIFSLSTNGAIVEGDEGIRGLVFNHFSHLILNMWLLKDIALRILILICLM